MDLFFIYIAIVYICLLVALLGSFLPILPGPLLAMFALVAFKIAEPSLPLSWVFICVAGFLTLLATIADALFTWLGAKKFGATWKGCLGSFVGVFVAIFIPPQIITIFIMPLIFAFAFELLGGRNLKESSKAGIGAFIGSILASLTKFIVVLIILLYFTWTLFTNFNNATI